MEPVFMVLGHSAADVAALALASDCAVQDLDYPLLAAQLKAEGQVLGFEATEAPRPTSIDLSASPGLAIDDEDAELTGAWTLSSAVGSFVGTGYRHDGRSSALAAARFHAKLPHAGMYELRLYFPPHANRSTQTLVQFDAQDGPRSLRVSQRRLDPGSAYLSLGRYRLDAESTLRISNQDSDGYVVIDAVEWIPLGPSTPRK
jgi:hypothetical protein